MNFDGGLKMILYMLLSFIFYPFVWVWDQFKKLFFVLLVAGAICFVGGGLGDFASAEDAKTEKSTFKVVNVDADNKAPILVIEPEHMQAYRVKSLEQKILTNWGTAFVMNGKIYAANHVIFEQTFIEVKPGDWREIKLLKRYKREDVAVFENIGLPSTPSAKLRIDTCSALASNESKPIVYTKGSIVTKQWGRRDLCFSSMRLKNGASGSPVYQNGGIVGMVSEIFKVDGVYVGCLIRDLSFLNAKK